MMNPLKSIISKYNEDTLIIVKLDVDTPDIEVPLAHQLLEDDNVNKLVDHFYFEHHVFRVEQTVICYVAAFVPVLLFRTPLYYRFSSIVSSSYVHLHHSGTNSKNGSYDIR